MNLDNCYHLKYSNYWPLLYYNTLKLYCSKWPCWTHGAGDKAFYSKALLSKIIWRLQIQSQQQVRLKRDTRSWLTEMEQSNLEVQIKGSRRDSVWTSVFVMKHLKKAEGYFGRNVVSITKKIWCHSNLLSISLQIILNCTFMCVAFKSHYSYNVSTHQLPRHC